METRNNGRAAGSADQDAGDRMGYGKPPRHSRFKKGRSGNPKGRPKGANGWKKVLEKVAGEMHNVTEGGKQRQRSTRDLVLLQLRNLAAEGNIQAIRELHKFSPDYDPQEAARGSGYLIVSGPLTVEEWIEMYGYRAGS